jgi:hypothetical protein
LQPVANKEKADTNERIGFVYLVTQPIGAFGRVALHARDAQD